MNYWQRFFIYCVFFGILLLSYNPVLQGLAFVKAYLEADQFKVRLAEIQNLFPETLRSAGAKATATPVLVAAPIPTFTPVLVIVVKPRPATPTPDLEGMKMAALSAMATYTYRTPTPDLRVYSSPVRDRALAKPIKLKDSDFSIHGGRMGVFTPAAQIPGLYWAGADVRNNRPFLTAYVDLCVDGKPVTTATCVLSGNFRGAPVPLTFSRFITESGDVLASYLSEGKGFYEIGKTYTLTVVTSKGTAWASAVAPGNIRQTKDGSKTTWDMDGEYSSIRVVNPSNDESYKSQPPRIGSPFVLPNWAFSAGPGTYKVFTSVSNASQVQGVGVGEYFSVGDLFYNRVVTHY